MAIKLNARQMEREDKSDNNNENENGSQSTSHPAALVAAQALALEAAMTRKKMNLLNS